MLPIPKLPVQKILVTLVAAELVFGESKNEQAHHNKALQSDGLLRRPPLSAGVSCIDIMYKLNITDNPDEPKIITRMKKSLSRSFIPTKGTHLEKIIWCAVYLHVLNRASEAYQLLNGFLPDFSETEKGRDQWALLEVGLAYFSHIKEDLGIKYDELKLAHELVDGNFELTNSTFTEVFKKGVNYSKERFDWYQHEETQKYRCAVLGEVLLSLVFILIVLPMFKNQIDTESKLALKREIEKVKEHLYVELTSS